MYKSRGSIREVSVAIQSTGGLVLTVALFVRFLIPSYVVVNNTMKDTLNQAYRLCNISLIILGEKVL